MKFQLLAFVHDLAALYVGSPGHWALFFYCMWVVRQQRRRLRLTGMEPMDPLLSATGGHLIRLPMPSRADMRLAWEQASAGLWRAIENGTSLLWSPLRRLT